MKEEIKEILDDLLFTTTLPNVTVKLNKEKLNQLKDYIINLQEENNRLKENAEHNDKVVDKAKWNEMIYKSRNEKAIEKIKKIQENAIKYSADHDAIICQDLLNILQGEDNTPQENLYKYTPEKGFELVGDDNEGNRFIK